MQKEYLIKRHFYSLMNKKNKYLDFFLDVYTSDFVYRFFKITFCFAPFFYICAKDQIVP